MDERNEHKGKYEKKKLTKNKKLRIVYEVADIPMEERERRLAHAFGILFDETVRQGKQHQLSHKV